MTIELSVEVYLGIGFVLILLGRIIHYRAVRRYLRDNKVAVKGHSTIRDWNDLAAYRNARHATHQPLTWWYLLWAIQIILFVWMVGWFAFAGGALKLVTPSHFVNTAVDQAGYRTVFDVAQNGYRHWPFALFGLIFVVAGFALPALVRLGIVRESRAWVQKLFPPLFVFGGLLWTSATLAGTFIDYRKDVDALRNGEAKIVEGRVEHYSEIPHKSESFNVQGVKFQYSDYGVIAGFNHMAALGGPIREG